MKVQKFEAADERRIVTALIVDDQVLAKLSSRWDDKRGMFESDWSNKIGQVCIDFYRKHAKAPGKAIESLYERYLSNTVDEETAELIAKYLRQLSDNFASAKKQINSSYMIELAHTHFNRVKLSKLSESIQSDVEAGDLERALKRVNSFAHIDMSASSAVDIADPELVESTYAARGEQLIEFEGALGSFLNESMRRDEFIAFMAPEKTGKTWWLIEVAYKAWTQGRRVAFFEVGDMSQSQLLGRFYTKITRTPKEPGIIKIPTYINKEMDSPVSSCDFEEKEFKEAPSVERVKKVLMKAQERFGKDMLRLSCHANSTVNVMSIQSILQTWERERGWIPDVIVIDYADILAPPIGVIESRDQINMTWKQLRSLSQQRNCLLVTATQSDAASYSNHILTKKNFSEDKRKFAHVTGMLGLNVNEEDKEQQITRINWILCRERKFSDSKLVHVAGCLDIGAPALHSSF